MHPRLVNDGYPDSFELLFNPAVGFELALSAVVQGLGYEEYPNPTGRRPHSDAAKPPPDGSV